MTEAKENPEFTFQSDKETGKAWINGPHNCLGRFGPHGWEIYQDMKAPVEVVGTTSTLVIRARDTVEKDWKDFVLLMKEHHNIDISDKEYPNGKS